MELDCICITQSLFVAQCCRENDLLLRNQINELSALMFDTAATGVCVDALLPSAIRQRKDGATNPIR